MAVTPEVAARREEFRTCARCGRKMKATNFYLTKDKEYCDLCKECLTAHIDNFDPETFLWVLEKFDVPYIPSQWNKLRDRAFRKDPKKINGMSVFGKYLSVMKLNQWNKYRWGDTERIQEELGEKEAKAKADMAAFEQSVKERFEKGEITEAEYKTYMSIETQNQEYLEHIYEDENAAVGENNLFNENDFLAEEELPDPAAQLSQEDKIYLAMKWGRLYKPDEWVSLEKKYSEMKKSFTINDSDSESALILICKTYLKMNQAADENDYETFQKLSRVYDSLRKGSKWTAAQNKDDKSDQFDSVGQLVLLCEREGGFIPRYMTGIPQDKVDQTIMDLEKYNYNLVTKDLGLGQQIETQLKKMAIQQQMEKDETPLSDDDHMDFYKEISGQREADQINIYGEEDAEDES